MKLCNAHVEFVDDEVVQWWMSSCRAMVDDNMTRSSFFLELKLVPLVFLFISF
jgi:hypothetical protein